MIVKTVEASYLLSPMQQGMLFHSLYAQEAGGVYIQQMLCTLQEPLDAPAFQRAWQQVLERHPILRTSFRWDGNEPQQEVQRQVQLPLEEQDWRSCTFEEQNQKLVAFLDADRRRGFDQAEAPLMRLTVLRIAKAGYIVLWTFHHALLDGRSHHLVLKELFTYYDAYCQGQGTALEPPRPYRAYIDWLQQQDWSKAEAYWRETLKGFSAPTPLLDLPPAQKPAPDEPDHDHRELHLSAELTTSLQALAKQHDLTLNTLVQGAWAVLLARYSGETDVVFGTTRACRKSSVAGAEAMIGLFINTLPLRAHVTPDTDLISLLKELRTQSLSVRPHEHTPLLKVQQWSEMPRGISLFDSIVVFENYQLSAALRALGGSWQNRDFLLLEKTNYPLALAVHGGSRILLKMLYHRDRYDAATIERMLGHMKTVLEGMVAHPEQRPARLPLLTEAERRQLLADWNDRKADYPRDRCIHQLFEEQVAKTPQAPALFFDELKLTYGELNACANQLAHHLQTLGVGPGALVAICVERSPEMLIGILAILKAGAAYVPLDPSYPRDQLAFQIEDSKTPLILTQQKLLKQLPTGPVQRLCLDTIWNQIAGLGLDNPVSKVTANHLAYVIYTSGTTGQPRGVLIAHQSLVHSTVVRGHYYQEPVRGSLLLSSFAFDSSIAVIFGTLCRGGALCVPNQERHKDPAYLAQLIARHRLSHLLSIPSLYHHLLTTETEQLGSLTTVVVAGETCPAGLVKTHYHLLSNTALFNEYGPTEATVWSTVYDCRHHSPGKLVPIGRPIANVPHYILDAALQPMPIGVAGELFLGGPGLARCYLNRKELTAEKFITDPFGDQKGTRLCRTGDRVRYLPDGNIEFLGRTDHQVKLRGFRIEPEGVAAVLSQHPAVHQAVVMVREDNPGDARLVAYVVTHQKPAPTSAELRHFVSEKLPEHMVPSHVVILKALPLLPNGKVDRDTLLGPDYAIKDAGLPYVPPGTPTEKAIAPIWAEVLGVPQVGRNDDFFILGGHSLKATQVVSRLRQQFQIDFPLQTFFEAPTLASFCQAVEAARATGIMAEGTAVAPVAREGKRILASSAQQRLWFLDQFIQRREVYYICEYVRIRGALDVPVFRKALEQLVARHESLRTTFASEDGQLFQVVADAQRFDLPVTDLSNLPPAEREAEARRLAVEDARKPFDLTTGPLWRVRLLRMAAEEHMLVLTLHHIITDGWSVGVIYRDLAVLYEVTSNGKPIPLPELPIQYADYSLWQRDRLRSPAMQAQLAYWRQHLAGKLPTVQLPMCKTRPKTQTFRGAVHDFDLSADLVAGLEELSRTHGATLFMTLLAAFEILLHRYSGQEDLIVGTPVAGRNRAEIEEITGFCVNSLVLRTDLSGDPPFAEFLHRIREMTLGAFTNQDVPFERLVEELRPPRDPSRQPLFQIMFVFQNMVMTPPPFQGLTLTPEPIHTGTAMFDLMLTLELAPQGLHAWFEYNTDLFELDSIERMKGHYQTVLEGLIANPGQRLSELPLLTDAERRQMLVEWNVTKADFPRDKCIHHLFEAQVERTPQAVAVICQGQQLTYLELNILSNQLAHHLRGLGVGPGMFVGICLERSLEMIIGVLGIVKAGGAYVPLDPAYPKDRLAFMLEDTRTPILLTQQTLLDRMPPIQGQVLCLDTIWDQLAGQTKDNPVSGGTANDLAYIIYTSGSTGRPKGVVLRHNPVVNLIDWVNQTFQVGPGDRLLFVTSLNFDLSVYDVFGTLGAGGTIRVATREELKDAERLLKIMCEEPITFWDSAPPTLQQLAPFFAGAREAARNSPLRLVFLSGDWIPVPLPDAVRGTFRKAEVISLGGATEAAIWSNFYRIGVVDPKWPSIPYGIPIQNARYHILDQRLNPVPVGVPAELHIGGLCLADGYLNRAELTAEKFIRDPFTDEPGARLYKTGDLARYFPDGNIEFLGRMDHQVKIRGFRIELGEIETVLGQHPGVVNSVVLALKDESGDRYLVGYVIPNPNQPPTPDELRSFLLAKLPDYMVPLYYVSLFAFPLSPNGKIDRKALPAPDRGGMGRKDNYVAPRNPTEETLAGIWAEVLGVKQVGIHDDFFALGGHSLKATQIVSRIRQQCQVDLPLPALFKAPTIEGLGQSVDSLKTRGAPVTLSSITPIKGDRTKVPASFAQNRFWLLDQLVPNREAYNVSFTVRLHGYLDQDALKQALQELTARHETLRTTFRESASQLMQVIAATQAVDLSHVDVSSKSRVEQEAVVQQEVREEARRTLDLVQGPLWRARLYTLEPQLHMLQLTLHHIIIDEWSRDVLFRDLEVLYGAAASNSRPVLPELKSQYADFSSWKYVQFKGNVVKKQLDYWRKRLEGNLPVLQLPTDRPRPKSPTYRGAHLSVELPHALIEAVHGLSQREGATSFMTLLAAFMLLLHRYSGQDDLLVGTPVSNREQAETEEMIGVFINTLVIRADLSGNPTFRELLAQVRRETLGAFEFQDLPFEQVLQMLRPERGASQQGLFQVLFTYMDEVRPPSTVEGVTWSVEPMVDNGTSKFDLTLFLENRPDCLNVTFEYNSDLFERATIERMIGHLQTLLEGIVINPEQRIDLFPFLTETERRQLLVEWNATEADYPRDRCLAQLIEEQAARTPNRLAVIFEDQQLTYGELNSRANQLAHHLKSLGAGPDVLVGLCVERSTEMVVGLLGILKAGAAYVPLDPEFPRDRLAFYVQDSQMPVLVTQERLLDRLTEHKARVVRLDTDWPTLAQHPTDNPPAASKPENLVYVIYTSGSTGKPKGVQVVQGALTNFLNSMRKQPGLTENDVLLAVTTLSFDIHNLEIWLPLLVGARVVIVSKEISSDGVCLLQRLNETRATVMQATPATWRLLLASGWNSSKQLKVLCGGEPMTVELAKQLLPRVAALWNMYGPTETTVWSTVYEVKEVSGAIPIGRPIDNTQVYIVDSQLQPVPVGGAGELLIGGDGLARGYLNRPELTAEKFIPDPFRPGKNNRLYKTGDLARYQPDGNIECLGRNDHQVKIRGFRIELGEIETVLGQYPAVRNAVVVARKEESGADYLVGYVIPQAGKTVTAEELRRYLNESLPDYMVPAHFVTLDSFPLTPNGKIDRKALPAPDRATSNGQHVIVAPRTDAERDLAAIWEEVLNVKPISVVDDFFELGGHSFLAAMLVSKIKLQLGHSIQLGTLFSAPTVEKLAAVLMRNLEAGAGSCIVPLHEEGTNPPLFMIAGVGGHVFAFHKFARLLGDDQPTYGVKAIGVEGTEEPPDRIDDIAARYLQEITALRPDGPYMLSGYSVGATVAFELALQLQAQGKKVERLIVFDMVAPGYPKPLPVYHRLWIHAKNFFKLPFAEKKSYVSERFWNVKGRVFRALGLGIYNAPAIVGVDALPQTALKKVWAALNLAQTRYKAQGKYDGKIILMKAEVGLHYAATIFDDPLMGWGEWTTQPIEEHTIPGAHLELFHEGHIQLMAEKLNESIQRLKQPVS